MIPEKILTHTPSNLASVERRKKELYSYLTNHTMDDMRALWKGFAGKNPVGKNKLEYIEYIAENLTFRSEKEFAAWFYTLPEISRKILWKAVFYDYIPVQILEKELNKVIAIRGKINFYYHNSWRMLPELKLDFLSTYCDYDLCFIILPTILKKAIQIWLLPPPGGYFKDCLTDEPPETVKRWNNGVIISESFPLLCESLKTLWSELADPEKSRGIRHGFNKKMLNELHTSSGLPLFDAFDAPDSADMTARFTLLMRNYKISRPEDGQDAVKKLITDFFSDKSLYPKEYEPPDRNLLEFNLLLDHLSKPASRYPGNDKNLPPSREVFYDILINIAENGGVFDADKLTDYIRFTNKNFVFFDRYIGDYLKIKANSFNLDEIVCRQEYDNDFSPKYYFRHELVVKPVFKAYCYLFAGLGLLEITQKQPPLVRELKGKTHPISAYDSLATVKITEFGRWCLDLTQKRPPKPKQEYEAIADKELFLVTVRGNSLERTLFLDKIGQKLGENRWRVSPASFIAGCRDKNQIQERITRFKTLIDPKPAPHWEALFKKTLARAGIFDGLRSNALVYTLPEDREITEELLRDPALKTMAFRAEGRMLIVPARSLSKFTAFLGEHGIASFDAGEIAGKGK